MMNNKSTISFSFVWLNSVAWPAVGLPGRKRGFLSLTKNEGISYAIRSNN